MKTEALLKLLDAYHFDYLLHEHPALFTVAESKVYDAHMEGGHCKNMLLNDKKRRNLYLIILEDYKRMDFKTLGEKIQANGLKFAKEETLERFDTYAGSVNPFIILEDQDLEIKVYMDRDLLRFDRINFHPNNNTRTVGLLREDFLAFMKSNQHEVITFDYKGE